MRACQDFCGGCGCCSDMASDDTRKVSAGGRMTDMLTLKSFVLLVVCGVFAAQATAASVSSLWGERGEKWTETSPLPDFRYAGYHCGRDPIPEPAVVADVKKHGAAGDGAADDTTAFLA